MSEPVAWLLLLSPMIVLTGVCIGLSCLLLKTCPACRLRVYRNATKCRYCHTILVPTTSHPKKEGA